MQNLSEFKNEDNRKLYSKICLKDATETFSVYQNISSKETENQPFSINRNFNKSYSMNLFNSIKITAIIGSLFLATAVPIVTGEEIVFMVPSFAINLVSSKSIPSSKLLLVNSDKYDFTTEKSSSVGDDALRRDIGENGNLDDDAASKENNGLNAIGAVDEIAKPERVLPHVSISPLGNFRIFGFVTDDNNSEISPELRKVANENINQVKNSGSQSNVLLMKRKTKDWPIGERYFNDNRYINYNGRLKRLMNLKGGSSKTDRIFRGAAKKGVKDFRCYFSPVSCF